MTKTVKGILIAIVGFVLLAGIVVGIMVGFGLYGWRRAMRAGNETAAVQNLKTITIIETQYYNTNSRNFGTFDQLVSESFLDKRFAGVKPIVDGYVYELRVNAKTSAQPSSYTVNADPKSADDGIKHFYADSTDGVVRVSSSRPATAADPPFLQ